MRRRSVVLIYATDPMVSAMLGMLAEMAQFQVRFPAPDERPEDALERVRPLVVVLLDGSLESSRSDLFFALAARRRVGLVLFGGPGSSPALAALALPRGVSWLELPVDVTGLARTIETAVASEWWRRGDQRRQDRRGAREQRARGPVPDGTVVYFDGDGYRWLVYDRRGRDRRTTTDRRDSTGSLDGPHDSNAGPVSDTRIFVGENGESRRCDLADGELEQFSSAALAGQLARAAPV